MRLSLLLPWVPLVAVMASPGCDTDRVTLIEQRPDAAGPSLPATREELPDSAPPHDAGPDAQGSVADAADARPPNVAPEPTRCEQLDRAFQDFVAANQACNADADCRVVGDCGPHSDAFAPVNAAGFAMAHALLEGLCPSAFDGPTYGPRCQGGRCVVGEQDGCCGCLSFDAGSDAQ